MYQFTSPIKSIPNYKQTYYGDSEGNDIWQLIEAQGDTETEIKKSVTVIQSYTNEKKYLTPRDLINAVNTELAESMAECQLSSKEYLGLVVSTLREFLLLNGNKKFNFLLTTIPIILEKDVFEYDIPLNYDVRNNLSLNKTCFQYCRSINQNLRFNFVPFQSWTNNNQPYTYTINNYRIYIRMPKEDLYSCTCHKLSQNEGHLNFEYYILPDPKTITDYEDEIYWLPSNTSLEGYLIEILKEKVLLKVTKQPYRSPNKAIYRERFLEFANGDTLVDSNRKIGKTTINFRRN